MKKKFILTAVLSLVLLCVFAFIYFYENEKIEDELNEKKLFVSEDLGQIIAIEFKGRGQESFKVKRSSKGWMFTSPFIYKVDRVEIDSVLDKISEIKVAELVEKNVDSRVNYGLENPVMSLDVEYESGKRRIDIGDLSFDNNKRYLENDLNGSIFYVNAGIIDSLLVNKDVVLDKHLLSLNANDLSEITMTYAGNELALELNEGEWSIKNKEDLIDQEKIEEFISRITNLEADSFYDGELDFTIPEHLIVLKTSEYIYSIKAITEEGNGSSFLISVEKEILNEVAEDLNLENFIFKIDKNIFEGIFLKEEDLIKAEEIL